MLTSSRRAGLDETVPAFTETLGIVLKDNAVKQEAERTLELQKSAIRTLAVLNRISSSGESCMRSASWRSVSDAQSPQLRHPSSATSSRTPLRPARWPTRCGLSPEPLVSSLTACPAVQGGEPPEPGCRHGPRLSPQMPAAPLRISFRLSTTLACRFVPPSRIPLRLESSCATQCRLSLCPRCAAFESSSRGSSEIRRPPEVHGRGD